MKTSIYKPKTIQEAIDDLQMFLECDLYSKFRPETKVLGKSWFREDIIGTEDEFLEYINNYFSILKEQIKELKLK